jgi:hypothetical protein
LLANMSMTFGKWPTIWHRDAPPIHAVISVDMWNRMHGGVYTAAHWQFTDDRL